MTRGFWSDNASGVHPRVLAALAEANEGHAAAYGADRWTAALRERITDHFGPDATVHPVFNGTGANVLAAQAMLRPWEALVAPATSHMLTDESTAPQRIGGTRILPVPHTAGKADAAAVVAALQAPRRSVHQPEPAALSLTQATEYGTVYSAAELDEFATLAARHGARLHLDGARLANAAVRLGTGLVGAAGGAALISFGGTKNGALGAEAVIATDTAFAEPLERLRKASAQLASKQRFLSAQLLALLEDDLWRRNAAHANAAATRLAEGLAELGLQPRYPVEANAVFIPVPEGRAAEIAAVLPVVPWDASTLRAVASFDTTEDDIDALLTGLAPLVES